MEMNKYYKCNSHNTFNNYIHIFLIGSIFAKIVDAPAQQERASLSHNYNIVLQHNVTTTDMTIAIMELNCSLHR